MVKPTFLGRFYCFQGGLEAMIEGKCPNCGRQYYGWALLQPRNQSCSECGAGLLITKDGGPVLDGYSPFTAVECYIDMPSDASKWIFLEH